MRKSGSLEQDRKLLADENELVAMNENELSARLAQMGLQVPFSAAAHDFFGDLLSHARFRVHAAELYKTDHCPDEKNQFAMAQQKNIMRTEQPVEGEEIKILPQGRMFEVLQEGQCKQVHVKHDSGQKGWVTAVNNGQQDLVHADQEDVEKEHEELARIKFASEVSGIECGCCFQEFTLEDTVCCRAGHAFCKRCLNSYLLRAVEGGLPDVRCISTKGCNESFESDVLREVIPSKILDLFERHALHRGIVSSHSKVGTPDHMRACPFCEGVAVVDGGTAFSCLNCSRESCLNCLEEVHPGLTCDEVKVRVNCRKTNNERLSEALIRTCPWCHKVGLRTKFLLSDGCNKVTCPTCKQDSCYLCGTGISQAIGYKHFCQHSCLPGEECKQCTKCQLFCGQGEAERIRLQQAMEYLQAGEESFQICGSWDDWKLADMRKEEQEAGDCATGLGELVFSHVFRLSWRRWEKFQIIRNSNWEQRLHPRDPCADPDSPVIFSGNSNKGHGMDWLIDAREDFTERPQDAGKHGDLYKIWFIVRGFWFRVNWQRVTDLPNDDTLPSPPLLPALSSETFRPHRSLHESPHSFCVVGSWSQWSKQDMRQLQYATSWLAFECTIHLNSEKEGNFQILRNGSWDQRLYPLPTDGSQADSIEGSRVYGPDVTDGHGKNWDIAAIPWARKILISFVMHDRNNRRVFWVELR